MPRTKSIKMTRDCVEHRPDGSGRRRVANTDYVVGDGPDQILPDIADDWIARHVATKTKPPERPTIAASKPETETPTE